MGVLQDKVAICIPTNNRTAYIREAVQNGALDIYREFGVDVYFYDSSINDETACLINSYQEEGYSNVYYIRLPSEMYLDTKLVMVLSGYGMEKLYEYIWPCRDTTWFLPETLKEIQKVINTGYDIIVLNPENELNNYYPEKGNRVYTDINDFYHEVGWYLTGMMCRLFRRETLIDTANWLQLYEKYRVWVPNGTFFEIGFIFEQISDLDKFSAIILSDNILFGESILKGANSHWRARQFDVWGKCWPETIEKLPDCYRDKDKIIKKKVHFNDVKLLKYLRRIGVLDMATFIEFYKKWDVLSDIPRWKFFLVAISPNWLSRLSRLREENYKKQLERKYIKIRKHIEQAELCQKKIIVYGAGEVGRKLKEMMDADGFSIWRYAVTKTVLKNSNCLGIPIVQIDNVMDELNNALLIVAVVPRIQKEIKKNIKELQIDNVIYL